MYPVQTSHLISLVCPFAAALSDLAAFCPPSR